MEVAGFVVSGLSLASLFQTAVDCFECIQISKEFATDFETHCLQLDNAQLRLTRWGQVVGIGGHVDAAASLQGAIMSARDVGHAETLLGHIITLFQQAEEASKNFRKTAGRDNVEFGSLIESLPRATAPLHKRVRDICWQRQQATGWNQKAKLVFYEKKRLSEVIDQIRDRISDLIELFPGSQPAQQNLCNEEAEALRRETTLPAWNTFVKHDHRLQEAVARLEARGVSSGSSTFNNYGGAKVANQVAGGQTINGGQNVTL